MLDLVSRRKESGVFQTLRIGQGRGGKGDGYGPPLGK